MKNFLFLLLMTASLSMANGQAKWQVTLNRKLVLTASEANDSVNTKIIKSTDWKSAGYLQVNYTETQPSAWLHAIHIADENGNDVLVKNNTRTTKISLSTLRKLFAGKKTMKIYLTISPPNPEMMAPSRMVTLAILKLP